MHCTLLGLLIRNDVLEVLKEIYLPSQLVSVRLILCLSLAFSNFFLPNLFHFSICFPLVFFFERAEMKNECARERESLSKTDRERRERETLRKGTIKCDEHFVFMPDAMQRFIVSRISSSHKQITVNAEILAIIFSFFLKTSYIF